MKMTEKSSERANEIISQAYVLIGKSQREFGHILGKNQSQISKYLRGKISPPAESIIHCLNIIHSKGLNTANCPATIELQMKIQKLEGEEYAPLRKALNTMIDAYHDK
jgi:transcriptional regulator with XRE-family HTH domain